MADYKKASSSAADGKTVRSFWTNFDRKSPATYEISKTPVAGFWEFRTNVEYEDLTLFWSEVQVKRFLFRMWDIYCHKKVSV